MKNITLSADEQLIHSAREKAEKENTSLNALFRQWLARYTEKDKPKLAYEELPRFALFRGEEFHWPGLHSPANG